MCLLRVFLRCEGNQRTFTGLATGTAQQALNTEGSTITSGSGASVEGGVFFRGIVIVGGNAGTVQFRWAQNTANASDSKVLAHSFLKACRIG